MDIPNISQHHGSLLGLYEEWNALASTRDENRDPTPLDAHMESGSDAAAFTIPRRRLQAAFNTIQMEGNVLPPDPILLQRFQHGIAYELV